MQEKKYSITGQSEMSSGALVRTEAVPCDFLLVAAGNMQDIQKMHPALRSGYGAMVTKFTWSRRWPIPSRTGRSS